VLTEFETVVNCYINFNWHTVIRGCNARTEHTYFR